MNRMSPSPGTERLLRLYPPAWRARYGEEFAATVEDVGLRPQLVIDIVSGAIDAWLSSEVRRAVRPQRFTADRQQGGTMTVKSMLCSDTRARPTTRDSLISAGVLLASAAFFAALHVYAQRQGWPTAAAILQMLAFPGSVVLSMPFAILKGQPWRAQAVFTVVPLAILVAIAYSTSLLNRT